MQRAFYNISIPDDHIFTPITISRANRPLNAVGSFALQSTLVEECLYAAQQSTLRAFANGHSVTAAAAANLCSDILGRVLLDSMSQRSESASSMLRPGDRLLYGKGGIGQAAFSVMPTAQKGLTNATKGEKVGVVGNDNEEELAALKQQTDEGIARSWASLNDLEVAVDYNRLLEEKLIQEMESTFTSGKKTYQLHQCIKNLSTVMEVYQTSSKEAAEQLITVVVPRVC